MRTIDFKHLPDGCHGLLCFLCQCGGGDLGTPGQVLRWSGVACHGVSTLHSLPLAMRVVAEEGQLRVVLHSAG